MHNFHWYLFDGWFHLYCKKKFMLTNVKLLKVLQVHLLIDCLVWNICSVYVCFDIFFLYYLSNLYLKPDPGIHACSNGNNKYFLDCNRWSYIIPESLPHWCGSSICWVRTNYWTSTNVWIRFNKYQLKSTLVSIFESV